MAHFITKWKSSDNIEIFAQGWEPDTREPKAVVCLVHGVSERSCSLHALQSVRYGAITIIYGILFFGRSFYQLEIY